MLNIDLETLHSFQVLSKELNFSRAAQSLGYTQQALSYQISQLENKLAFKLFDRLPKTLKLTPKAKALLKELPNLFSELQRTQNYLGNFAPSGHEKKVVVYISNGWDCDYLTLAFLKIFVEKYPDIKLDFQWTVQENIHLPLEKEKNCFSLGYRPIDNNSVKNHCLFDAPAVLAVSTKHKEKEQDPPYLAFSQSHRYPFSKVFDPPTLESTLEKKILRTGLQNSQIAANDIHLYLELALAGTGTIFTHYEAVRAQMISGELKVLQSFPEITCQAYISWVPEHLKLLDLQLLIDSLNTLT